MISIFIIISSFLITTDGRTALFCVITQRLVVISYRRFRTTCPSDYWLLKMRTDTPKDTKLIVGFEILRKLLKRIVDISGISSRKFNDTNIREKQNQNY